jgi:hypothetical protein
LLPPQDAITAGSNDLDAAAIAKLAARKAAAVESSRAKTPTRPSPAQPPKPRQPRPPKRPKAAPSDTESDLSPSDEDKKPKIKKAKVHAKLPPKDTDYVSNLLPQPDSTALMVDEDSTMMVGLEYVIGDATQPSPNTTRQLTGKDGESFTTQDTTAVTLHCVDTSGRWGAGGMFTAINNLYGGRDPIVPVVALAQLHVVSVQGQECGPGIRAGGSQPRKCAGFFRVVFAWNAL